MSSYGLLGPMSEYQSEPETIAGGQIKEGIWALTVFLNMLSTNPPAFSPTFTSATSGVFGDYIE